jgi:hypothetical protein
MGVPKRAAVESCATCGAKLAPLERLQEAAWQGIRDRSLWSAGSGLSGPAFGMVPEGYEDGSTAKRALFLVACELAHRTGRCQDEVVCPGSYDDVGDPNVNPWFTCQVCLCEVDVEEDGRLCVHPMKVAQ